MIYAAIYLAIGLVLGLVALLQTIPSERWAVPFWTLFLLWPFLIIRGLFGNLYDALRK